MKVVLFLLTPRKTQLLNQWNRSNRGQKSLIIFFSVFGFLFFCGLMAMFWTMIDTLHEIEIVGDIVLKKLLEILMLSMFGLLCFSNVVTALSNYYLSEDLELLLSLPIDRRHFHFARLIETIVQSSWMIASVGLGILICYGIVYGADWVYYPLCLMVMAAFLLIPGAFGLLTASLTVRIFPARRVREALMLVGVLSLVFIFVLLRWLKPERLANSENFENVAAYVAELQTPAPIFTPPQWATEVLLAGMSGREFQALEFGLLISGAIGIAAVARWVTDAIYDEGRAKAQEARAARLAKAGWLDRIIEWATPGMSQMSKAIVTKDIKTFFRDPSQWSQLFLVASIVAIALISVASLPTDAFRGPWMRTWINALSFLILALVGFVMAALAARFQFSAVSNEGRAFWWVRTAPISAQAYLRAKAWPGFLPMLIIGEALAISSATILHADPILIAVAMTTAAGLSISLTALAIGMGAMTPNFKIDNAAKLAATPGGMLYMIIALSLVFLTLAIEAAPVFFLLRSGANEVAMTPSQTMISIVCTVLLIGLWTAATVVPMKLGAKALWGRELPNA